MKSDIKKAMNFTNTDYTLELKTQLDYTRKGPATAKVASLT